LKGGTHSIHIYAVVQTNCSACGGALEFPEDFDDVICSRCGAAYLVRRHGTAVSLLLRAEPYVDNRLVALEAELQQISSSIEELKGEEHGLWLRLGCSVFGLFCAVILVLAIFMTVARNYFGGKSFYALLLVLVAAWLWRTRVRLISARERERLRAERSMLEAELAEKEAERERLRRLARMPSAGNEGPTGPG
jgi:predicted RNA-binding Zn-ribbon protein involved in translation (DUF1610 family)